MSEAKQNLVLRAWIQQQGYSLPSAKKIATIKSNLLRARSDRKPCVEFAGIQLRRFKDDIYLLPMLAEENVNVDQQWDFNHPLVLEGIGCLTVDKKIDAGLSTKLTQVNVRFRVGGEKIFVNGKHRTLKNCLQEWSVPIWQRARLPLIFCGEELIAVVNYFIDERYKAKESEPGYCLTFAAML